MTSYVILRGQCGIEAEFPWSIFGFDLIIIIPPLLHTLLQPSSEVHIALERTLRYTSMTDVCLSDAFRNINSVVTCLNSTKNAKLLN